MAKIRGNRLAVWIDENFATRKKGVDYLEEKTDISFWTIQKMLSDNYDKECRENTIKPLCKVTGLRRDYLFDFDKKGPDGGNAA